MRPTRNYITSLIKCVGEQAFVSDIKKGHKNITCYLCRAEKGG